MRDSKEDKNNVVSMFVSTAAYDVVGSSIPPLVQDRPSQSPGRNGGHKKRRGNIPKGTFGVEDTRMVRFSQHANVISREGCTSFWPDETLLLVIITDVEYTAKANRHVYDRCKGYRVSRLAAYIGA